MHGRLATGFDEGTAGECKFHWGKNATICMRMHSALANRYQAALIPHHFAYASIDMTLGAISTTLATSSAVTKDNTIYPKPVCTDHHH